MRLYSNSSFICLIFICILPLHSSYTNEQELHTRLEALEKKVSSLENEIRAAGRSYKDFLTEIFSEYYELIPDDLRNRIQNRFNFTINPSNKTAD